MCGNINCNKAYLCSPPGVLILLELVFGFLCWSLTAQFSPYSAPHQFIMFVSVTTWLLTLMLFFVYLLGLDANQCSSCPWNTIEFFFLCVCSVFYLVGACVSAAYNGNIDELIAATFFAFFALAVYVIHSFVSYRKWKGSFPWQSNIPTVSVNT